MEDKPFVKEKQFVMIGENKDLEVILPRLTLKKIMAVTDGVDKLVNAAKEKSPQVFELFNKNDGNISIGIEVVKLLPAILPILMTEITNVLAAYLDKEPAWVQENMDMEDLVAVATPFFANILKQGNHLTGALGQMFPKSADQQTSPLLQ
jgi:hypothetical protein